MARRKEAIPAGLDANNVYVPGMENLVWLTNRTTGMLQATWNGVLYPLRPGRNLVTPEVAHAAFFQNPLMGSEVPGSPDEFTSLVGVESYGHEVTPLEQSASLERIDRSMLSPDEQDVVAIVQPKRGVLRSELTSGPMGSLTSFRSPSAE